MGIQGIDLLKQYRRKIVVDHVSLHVEPGEVVGLLGPNGAGKTTTFAMLVGLTRVKAGRIILDDDDITYLPLHRRSQMGVVYLPQEPSVFRKLSVEDNVKAVLELMGGTPSEKRLTLERIMHEFQLDAVRHQNGMELSGGERRRTEIARALAASPRFLLLDEPLAGIDPIAVGEIQRLVSQLRSMGLGILITDHNVRETLRITDRAYIMHEGRILVSGTAAEVASNAMARQHYLGETFQL